MLNRLGTGHAMTGKPGAATHPLINVADERFRPSPPASDSIATALVFCRHVAPAFAAKHCSDGRDNHTKVKAAMRISVLGINRPAALGAVYT